MKDRYVVRVTYEVEVLANDFDEAAQLGRMFAAEGWIIETDTVLVTPTEDATGTP